MKTIIAVFLILCVAYYVSPNAQAETWQTVSIPEICTFQIPPTMEIQKGNYKQGNEKFQKEILEIPITPDRVVVQQKGLNSFDPQALKRYSRVIVETARGQHGDYETLYTPLIAPEGELIDIDAVLKQQIQQSATQSAAKGMKLEILSWQPTKIVRVNGIDALKTSYSRSMNNGPPTVVNIYMIQNNDYMHRITISYRLAEKSLWATDLMKVINTFKFKKR
jgi:hypothetical protein